MQKAGNSSEDSDEDFEEAPDQRTFPHFLKDLPGVTATDSMGYRIEALRVYLEQQLGDILFIAAYKHLIVSHLHSFFLSFLPPNILLPFCRTCQVKMIRRTMSWKASLGPRK